MGILPQYQGMQRHEETRANSKIIFFEHPHPKAVIAQEV